MPAITQTELDEAALDAKTIEDVVNGNATINGTGIVTSRLGQPIRTLAKVIADIAGQDVGASVAADINRRLAARVEYATTAAMEAAEAEGDYGYVLGSLHKIVSSTATPETTDELAALLALITALQATDATTAATLAARAEYATTAAMEAGETEGDYGYVLGVLHRVVAGTATPQTTDEATRLDAAVRALQAVDVTLVQQLAARTDYATTTAMEAALTDGQYGYVAGALYRMVGATATAQTADELAGLSVRLTEIDKTVADTRAAIVRVLAFSGVRIAYETSPDLFVVTTLGDTTVPSTALSPQEVIDARGTFASLGQRLDDVTGRLPAVIGVLAFSGMRTSRLSYDELLVSGETLGGVEIDLDGGESADTALGLVAPARSGAPISGRSTRQAFLRLTNTLYEPVTSGPYEAALVDQAANEASVRRNGVVDKVKWLPTRVSGVRFARLVLFYGQSLILGFKDGAQFREPVYVDPVHRRAWQFDAANVDGVQSGPRPAQYDPIGANSGLSIDTNRLDRLAPLRSDNHRFNFKFATTSAETCAHALLTQVLPYDNEVVVAVVGTGSTQEDAFLPTTPHMVSIERAIDAFIARCAERGWTPEVTAVVSNIGEESQTNGRTSAQIKADWLAIKAHVTTYAQNAVGTARSIPPGTVPEPVYVIQQTNQLVASATGSATIAQAELVQSGDALAVPLAPMRPGYSGSTHLEDETYMPLGSATAYLIGQQLVARDAAGTYVSPHVAVGGAVQVNTTTVDVTWTGGDAAQWIFDTTTLPDATDGFKGFGFEDSGGVLPIQSMAFTGAKTIRFTTTRPVSGPNTFYVGAVGTSPDPDSGVGRRINMRDATDWPCAYTGQPVSGWPIVQHVTVT